MIFFVGNDGTIVKSIPSAVYQNSANSNVIYLIAPWAVNSSVTVAFKLPNGIWLEPKVMKPEKELQGVVNEKTGISYIGWSYVLEKDITRYYGTVTAQFFFYTSNGAAPATSSTTFSVSKGVPTVLPAMPAADIYETILSNIALLTTDTDNAIEKINNKHDALKQEINESITSINLEIDFIQENYLLLNESVNQNTKNIEALDRKSENLNSNITNIHKILQEVDGEITETKATLANTKSKVDNFFSEAGAAGMIDTLTEIVEYIEKDEQGAINLAEQVANNTSQIESIIGKDSTKLYTITSKTTNKELTEILNAVRVGNTNVILIYGSEKHVLTYSSYDQTLFFKRERFDYTTSSYFSVTFGAGGIVQISEIPSYERKFIVTSQTTNEDFNTIFSEVQENYTNTNIVYRDASGKIAFFNSITSSELVFEFHFNDGEDFGIELIYVTAGRNGLVQITTSSTKIATEETLSATNATLADTKAKVDNFLSETGVNGVIDTLTEIVDYIEKDEQGAIDLAKQVANNTSQIESIIGNNKAGVFSGTRAKYETAYAAGEIPVGTIVIITDDGEYDDTTAVLGEAILGRMILG